MPSIPAHVAVVEVQAAGAEDRHREVELGAPVADDRPPEEALCPCVHLARHLSRDVEEHGLAREGEAEIALVVERHGRSLPERVFAVEHPAVGAREQGVGDVAQAGLERGPGPGSRAGALNPLPIERGGDVATAESTGARVGDADGGAADDRVVGEEADVFTCRRPRCAPVQPRGHQRAPIAIERRQQFEGRQRRRGEDVGVARGEVPANLQRTCGLVNGRTRWHGAGVYRSPSSDAVPAARVR